VGRTGAHASLTSKGISIYLRDVDGGGGGLVGEVGRRRRRAFFGGDGYVVDGARVEVGMMVREGWGWVWWVGFGMWCG